jgi:hypothetical protein
MNRFLAILIVLFTSAGLLQAQQYVRVKKDFEDSSIKFFKGEIYVYDSVKKQFTVNGKKFKRTDNVELYTGVKQLKDTDRFVEEIEIDGKKYIQINISSVDNGNDTVWLANSKEKAVPILTNKTLKRKSGDLENSFRLIIPNAETIWYNKKNSFSWWWIYAMSAVLLLIIIRRRKTLLPFAGKHVAGKASKPFRTAVFNVSIMSEFADKYGGMDKLYELNPGLIPSPEKWNTMDDYDKRSVIIRLQGKSVKIPFETTVHKDIAAQPAYRAESHQTSLAIEKVRLEEQLKFKNSEINRLHREKESLTAEKVQLEYQLQAKSEEINLLQQEKIQWHSEYVSLSEYKALETRYDLLNGKTVSVDFLRDFAESVSAYFSLCREAERQANSYYERIVLRYDYNAAIIACLLQKFRNSIYDVPVGEWRQIIKDIADTGITANRQVIRILSQPSAESEKQREFRRILFREVIIRYSSSILILAESFRNLARFGIDGVFADEAGKDFGEYVTEIEIKAKTIDVEIKYVPLFEKFDAYSAKVESVNQNRSFPYSEVHGLEQDSIAEIVSYGVKTEFEDIKTQIIID